jgi:hypothetical protein
MRIWVALLLMSTPAVAQSNVGGSGIGLNKYPVGDILRMIGVEVSGRGTVTARIIIENVSGRPLAIAANGDAPASIGACGGAGTGQIGSLTYAGIPVGYDAAKHASTTAGSIRTLQQALQPFSPASTMSISMQMTNCNLTGQSTAKVTIPVFVRDSVQGEETLALTAPDVPVIPQ